MGSAKISTFTRMRAEHICVDPRTMKPKRKLSISSNLMVFVIVYLSVYLLMLIMPIPSKMHVIRSSQDKEAFL